MRPAAVFLTLSLTACGGAMVMPKAPSLLTVEKMDGALMVKWKNNEGTCDAVEGERKSSTEAYKSVFSVPGEADNKHDTTATADTTFTYRLRCKKGGMDSSYSSELSANPVK